MSGVVELRLQTQLEALCCAVEDLPVLESLWEGYSRQKRLDAALAWRALISGNLGMVHERYVCRQMSAAQRGEYERLLSALARHEPTIRRLGLYPAASVIGPDAAEVALEAEPGASLWRSPRL